MLLLNLASIGISSILPLAKALDVELIREEKTYNKWNQKKMIPISPGHILIIFKNVFFTWQTAGNVFEFILHQINVFHL